MKINMKMVENLKMPAAMVMVPTVLCVCAVFLIYHAFQETAGPEPRDGTQGGGTGETVDAESKEGGENMDEELMTKEEFLKKIAEDSPDGLTPDDFAEIDVDGFISDHGLTPSKYNIFRDYGRGNLKRRVDNLKRSVDELKRSMDYEKVLNYRAQTLTVADSTREEYIDFRDRFFEVGEVERHTDRSKFNFIKIDYIDEGMLTLYRVAESSRPAGFFMGRTADIDRLMEDKSSFGWSVREEGLSFRIYTFESGPTYYPVFISRSGKFFMAMGRGSHNYSAIRTFCEMDD